MQTNLLRACVLAVCSTLLFAPAPRAQETDKEIYSIVGGQISGLTGDNQVTIMINRRTGQTWLLALVAGQSPKWLPLTYSETVPRHTLPPPANAD